MVMETPGPQEVGREFVRQYYTMLHEAPLHLHRFYSNDSAFVHGGVEKAGNEQPPVIGQEAIHKKIVSLNFHDCHAKIRQVDSQSTVEDAVVVQVTGELSNNGEPMRRFMQTFVLVRQTPKKFYVHNDIFRYQDEVFHDDDGEPDESDRFITDPRDDVIENGSHQEPTPNISTDATPSFYEVPLSNGTAVEEPVEPAEPVTVSSPPVQTKPEIDTSPTAERDSGVSEEAAAEESFEQKPEPVKPAPPEPAQPDIVEPAPEPKHFSWATVASKNTAGMSVPPAASTYSAPPSHASKPPVARTEPAKPEGNPTQAPQAQRAPRQTRERFQDREKNSASRGEGDGDADSVNGRRSNSVGGGGGGIGSKLADNHQLFVGNLHHEIKEKDLKTFFERYGKVEDLRINTKSGGSKVPNFGFVVFENPDTVQEILKQKPIKYNEHRLNVEEKKPRGSDGTRGGRGGMPRGGGMGGQGIGSGRSGAPYGSGGPGGRSGIKGGGFGRQDMRGSQNLSGGSRGGMSQQLGRR